MKIKKKNYFLGKQHYRSQGASKTVSIDFSGKAVPKFHFVKVKASR